MLPFPVPPPPVPAWLTDNRKPADDPAPSLRSHYRSLTATTSRSATRAEPPLIATGHRRVASGDGFGARLLPFRSGAAGRVHVASMPDTAWPVGGPPPGSSRDTSQSPGFDVVCLCFDTSAAIRLRSSPRPPPDTSMDAFSSIAHHNSLQLMQHEAV